MSGVDLLSDRGLFAALGRRHLNSDNVGDEVDLPPRLTEGAIIVPLGVAATPAAVTHPLTTNAPEGGAQ